jgi:hypothetical protein
MLRDSETFHGGTMEADPHAPEEQSPALGYPALRLTGRIVFGLVLLVLLVYYPFWAMLLHTLIPFMALAAIGFFVGLFFRRHLFLACFFTWWLVLMASVLRRSALATVPLATQIFDGALLGYPTFAVWFAEALRQLSYFAALWLGARLGRRVRGGPSEVRSDV